jgi:hypothetical protein
LASASKCRKGSRQQFIDWLISAEGQTEIASYKINGQQLFYPNADRLQQSQFRRNLTSAALDSVPNPDLGPVGEMPEIRMQPSGAWVALGAIEEEINLAGESLD